MATRALHASVLRYLTEIVRTGSIRRASVALNVAASAVNRQVLRLEADLGTKIFDRLPIGMRLTPAGELLLRHIRATLGGYDRLLADLDGLHGIRSGHVALAALDSLLVEFVPTVLAEVGARYPAVTFAAVAASPAAILSGVADASFDIGLSFVVPSSLPLELVASIAAPLGCIMRADHPLAGRASLDLAELEGMPVMLQDGPLPGGGLADDAFAAFRAGARPRFLSNSIELLRHLLLAGAGVACFTRLGFLREIAAGTLVWVPLAVPRLEALQLGLFIGAQRSLNPAGTQVVNALARGLRALGAA